MTTNNAIPRYDLQSVYDSIQQRFKDIDQPWYFYLGTVFGITLMYYLTGIIYNLYFHPLSHFPGPRLAAATQLPVSYFSWKGRLSHWLHALHEQYQTDVVRISPNELNFIAQDAWQDIHAPSKEHPPFQKDLLVYKGVTSIVAAPDDDHRRIRRLVNHAFSDRALREQETLLQFHVNRLVRNLSEYASNGGSLNLSDHCMFVIFDIISDLSFGTSFNSQEYPTFRPWALNMWETVRYVALKSVLARFYGLETLLHSIIFPAHTLQIQVDHFKWTYEQVQKRLNLETTRPDFLTYITKHNLDPQQGGMTPEEIHINMATFMSAGTETTANTSTAAIFLLLKNLTYHARLVEDIRATFPTAESINLSAIIEKLPFLQAVISETMRFYPTALAGQARLAPRGGAVVAGHFVPEYTAVQNHQYPINRSPRYFHAPDTFVPERWLDEGGGKEGGKLANDKLDQLNPFGIGVRNCVGKNLALAEIRLILTNLLWHFDFELDERTDEEWTYQRGWFTWEKKAMWVRVKTR